MSWDAFRRAADRLTAVWPEEVQAAARVLEEGLAHERECASCHVAGAEIEVTALALVSGPYSGDPVDEDLGRAIVELAVEVARSPQRCEQISSAPVAGLGFPPAAR